jgi:AraC-like DNA-binding protein
MLEHVWNVKKESTDLNVCQFGIEQCQPLHAFGPAVRDHFLVHCVLGGKGIFQCGDKQCELCRGQGFLICPGVVTYYQADKEEPWTYAWIGFQGVKAEYYLKSAGLDGCTPVFSFPDAERINGIIREMLSANRMDTAGELAILSCLYDFLGLLVQAGNGGENQPEGPDRSELYIRKTIECVEKNYSGHIKIRDVARAVGLDRSYLGAIFRKSVNMTLKEFLTAFRMNRACELLEDRRLTVGDVARSVGYDDPLLFSKTFKNSKGASPSKYRGGIINRQDRLEIPGHR